MIPEEVMIYRLRIAGLKITKDTGHEERGSSAVTFFILVCILLALLQKPIYCPNFCKFSTVLIQKVI